MTGYHVSLFSKVCLICLIFHFFGIQYTLALDEASNYKKLGSVDTPGFASSIAISNSKGYVVESEDKMHIIGISDPANPEILGSVSIPGYVKSSIDVKNEVAYICGYNAGLQIVDVSKSEDPEIITSIDTFGYAMAVEVVGKYAYVAAERNGLQVIDISNPKSPFIQGSIETS